MHDAGTTHEQTRIVLLGMRCAFTRPVLTALLAERAVDLQAMVLPGPTSAPADDPITRLADRHAVPVMGMETRSGLRDRSFRAAMNGIAPDVIIVACFPWRIPAWLRALPGHGCLNVHPSLLPEGRGPEPVFWALRWGGPETGVTLHLMDAGFDTGPVVAQARHAISDDVTLESLERDLATIGAGLLLDTLPALADGTFTTSPQPPGPQRYAPVPDADDITVPTSWRASRAARFIGAVTPAHGPVPVLVQSTGQRLAVADVIDANDAATLPDPVVRVGEMAHVRFSPGVLTIRLHAPVRPLAVRTPG
jgi:methionyl-tRNA formyltransferase